MGDQIYDGIVAIVKHELMDEDARGGPMQRQYPTAVIDSIAATIATEIMEQFNVEL